MHNHGQLLYFVSDIFSEIVVFKATCRVEQKKKVFHAKVFLMEVKVSGRFFIDDESNKSNKDFEDEDFAIKIEVSASKEIVLFASMKASHIGVIYR